MRSRVIAGCVVAALARGVQAAGAAAAKQVLWVDNFARERVAPGTAEAAVTVFTEFDRTCGTSQQAQLATNGKAKDAVTNLTSAVDGEQCGGEKTAGGITSIALKPTSTGQMTITAKDSIHVDYAEEWCVYALPKTFSLPASGRSFGEENLTGALDKAASFGTCAPTRTIKLVVTLAQTEFGEPFEAEVL